jgi:hypothetical protein
MQRISVDLPAPDGPQMTVRSPTDIESVMSLSTAVSPKDLLTEANSIAGAIVDVISKLDSNFRPEHERRAVAKPR